MNLSTRDACLFVACWTLMGFLLIISGRNISCYYPFLLSRKHYFTIRNPRLQGLLIADGINRSRSTKTRPEDRNKISASGTVYYAILFVLLAALCLSNACIIIECLTHTGVLSRERLLSLSSLLGGFALLAFLVLFFAAWIDYGLGKLLNGK